MIEKRIENLNIKAEEPLMTPDQLKKEYPLSENVIHTVMVGQNTVKNILAKKDHRLFVVVGPCSIHDTEAAREYAGKLKNLADELKDSFVLIMRIYFEKPRTSVGWQGLINDPYLDNSCRIEDGLKMARHLLLYVGELGLPAAGEALDLVTPQYVQDLFSWTAIGARTTESQTHRTMASGLSSAVGFKNGTDGNIEIAINALSSAALSNNFISVDPFGQVAVIRTTGNPYTHIILRGGRRPNYDPETVAKCEEMIKSAGFIANIMVDCSHANSGKDPANQLEVLENVTKQIENGNRSIAGLMMESNLHGGNQPIPKDLKELKYGVSVTDPCLDWETTEKALRKMRGRIKDLLPERIQS